MRKIAVFDFDGTLTSEDTLFQFLRFSFGMPKAVWGFMLFSPIIFIMKLHLFDNSRCKAMLLSYFLKGMKYSDFERLGMEFSSYVDTILRRDTHAFLLKHLSDGDDVYVISASVEEWVKPFCMGLGVKAVLGTKMEVDANGVLTGRFSTRNCYGPEKVKRLLEIEPDRQGYTLYAYGDSNGDKQMFEFADYHRKV